MEKIALFFNKVLFWLIKQLTLLFCWILLTAAWTVALTQAVSLFATQRYQQGDTPHRWFSVAVYATDGKGERFVSHKSLSHLSAQDELWQGSEPHYDDFGVARIGEQTYELTYEIGLGMAYAAYRIENGRVVPLRFDHQWYASLCLFVSLFLAAYCVHFVSRKIKSLGQAA